MAKKMYGFDENGVRRIREAIRRVNQTPIQGAQHRRQVPVLGSSGGGPSGDACGCGPCVALEGMTVDFGAEWDAAETYTLNDGTELTWDSGDSCWYSPVASSTCDESSVDVRHRLLPTGTAAEECVLEYVLWDTGGSTVTGTLVTWKNTVSMWKPHCPTWLFLISLDSEACPELSPACSFCLSPVEPEEEE